MSPLRIAILAAVATGGVAALSWEILWQLAATLALGLSALGTALTLAATMGGMAIGSLGMGRWLRGGRSVARPLRAYAALEATIGLWGLVILPAFAAVGDVDAAIYRMAPPLAPFTHAFSILVVLGPPTIAMGATVPVFQLVARSYRLPVSVLYGLNTAGAFAGVLLVSFVVLPALGVTRTSWLVAGLNLTLAAVLLAVPRPGVAVSEPEPSPAAANGGSLWLPGLVVFGTGLVTFGLEVAWFRALRTAFWSTTDSFAIILASVLGPLALGAHAAAWLYRRGVGPGATLAAAAAAILLATPLVERMDLFATSQGSYGTTMAWWLVLSIVILGPAMLLLGVALPWYLEAHRDPHRSGRLYALNTAGAVAGSLLAAWWWLPSLGFAPTAWLLGVAVALLALLVNPGRMRFVAAVAGAAALVVAMTATSSPGRHRAYREEGFGGKKVLAIHEGPDTTTSVVETPRGLRWLMIDGFLATVQTPKADYMQWMGRLPMLLHPDPKRGLVICFGTGKTAWSVLDEGPEALDVVDVSEAVLRMAPLFPSNHGVLEDPRTDPIVMDGRAWLRRSDHRYDVITLEPMPPNFAGVNNLYSREFYETAAARLTPGGVVAQWLPFHLVTPHHSKSIAATFLEVFPDALLWVDPVSSTGILLGRTASEGAPLGTTWPGFAREPGLGARPLDPAQVRAQTRLGSAQLVSYAAHGTVITDDNQLLAFGDIRPGEGTTEAARQRGRWNRQEVRTYSGAPRSPTR